MDGRLDAIDLMILRELQQDGRLSVVDLAQRVGLSPSPCLRRLRALEERNVIDGYRALVNPRAIGLGLEAFVFFRVESHAQAPLNQLRQALLALPEVVAFYALAGDPDAMLHVTVPDLAAFEQFLYDRVMTLPIRTVRSSFVLRVHKKPAPLPLGHLEAAIAADRT